MDRNKLKILFLITDLGRGGAERILIDLCTELNKYLNIEFVIGTLFNNNQYSELTKKFKIINLNYKPYSFLKHTEYPEYKKLLDDFQPNIIHTHRFLAEFLSSFYVNNNIKYVCHAHDNIIQLKKWAIQYLFDKKCFLNYLERKRLIKEKYNKVQTHFIAVSNDTENYLISNLPSSFSKNIFLLHNAINFQKFENKPTSTVSSQNDKLKLINIGSFHNQKKNQEFLIEIAQELLKQNIDFEIHLLGDGKLRKNLEQKVSEKQLSPYFVFHGNVENVSKHLQESDIYIHSAKYEPFGLVLLEAMAAGLPVVSLDAGGNKDFIENEVNGYIINEQNPKLFSDQIQQLYSNKDLYLQIAENGQNTARNYNIKEYTNKLTNIYQKSLIKN